MMTPLLLPLGPDQRVGRRPVMGRHTLTRSDLFDDVALVALIDRFPRHNLYALSMGEDPARSEDNRLALHTGVSGAELLRAVRHGRLWLNLKHVEQADRACAR